MKRIIISLLKSILAILAYVIGGGIVVALLNLASKLFSPFSGMVIMGLATMIGGVGAMWLLRKLLDRKSIMSLGYQWRSKHGVKCHGSDIPCNVPHPASAQLPSVKCYGMDILWGFLLGMGLIAVGTVFLLAIGSIEVVGTSFSPIHFIGTFIMFIGVAIGEETCFRGYILSNLMDSMNKYVALFVSAILFSVPHLINPHPSVMSFLGVLFAGLLLGAAFIYTRNLWFPIGIHLSWNFFQAMVGFNVSGTENPSYLILKYPEYNIINGGEFGFESSLVCLVLLALATAVVLYRCRRRCTEGGGL